MPDEQRNIRYYGILKPPEDALKAKQATLAFTIIRPQTNLYMSKRSNPKEFFFGYAALMFDDRVLDVVPLRYEKQIIFYFFNDNLWLHQNISCHLETVLTSFINLGMSMGLPPIERNNPIENWECPTLPFDEVRIQLEAETSVCELKLTWDEMEECEAGGNPPTFKPPPVRQPPPKLPPNAPDSELPPISLPYEGPNDNGNTYVPGQPPDGEPPYGEDCQVITYTVRIYGGNFAEGPFIDFDYTAFGPVDAFIDPNNNTRVVTTHRGLWSQGAENVCKPEIEEMEIIVGASDLQSVEIAGWGVVE